MTMDDPPSTGRTLTFIAIHLLIPFAGLIAYFLLLRRMGKQGVTDPPAFELFALFAIYGGLLVTLLTQLFWYWSGMASLGVFFLVFIAPLVLLFTAYRTRTARQTSRYHRIVHTASWAYFLIAPVVIGLGSALMR